MSIRVGNFAFAWDWLRPTYTKLLPSVRPNHEWVKATSDMRLHMPHYVATAGCVMTALASFHMTCQVRDRGHQIF